MRGGHAHGPSARALSSQAQSGGTRCTPAVTRRGAHHVMTASFRRSPGAPRPQVGDLRSMVSFLVNAEVDNLVLAFSGDVLRDDTFPLVGLGLDAESEVVYADTVSHRGQVRDSWMLTRFCALERLTTLTPGFHGTKCCASAVWGRGSGWCHLPTHLAQLLRTRD